MKKYSYQTCLRLPEPLMEEMTSICDHYRINASDFMRRAIAESVVAHQKNLDHPDQKFVFV